VPAVAAGARTAELPNLRWPPPRPATDRLIGASAIVLAAVIMAWAIWQPEASERATGRALELIDERDYAAAISKTEDAEDANPLSPDPLFVRAVAETSAGQENAARHTLEQAVLKFPGDPQSWLHLARFQLATLDRPDDALETVQGVLYLDPFSAQGRQLFLDARIRLREKQAAAAQP
jgi:tetratricopeptide (TPR) repeat protein